MTRTLLDLDAVLAFVRIAEFGSFTLAAKALQTTQSAVSLKLKRLEAQLDRQLVARTSRRVQLSVEGAAFLDQARALLEAHDRAIGTFEKARQRLSIGFSDHVAGADLPQLIARLRAEDPQLLIEIHIGSSLDLIERYDRRELDAVVVLEYGTRSCGENIVEQPLGWFAARHWQYVPQMPLPIATMPEPCQVRQLVNERLDSAQIAWDEVFVGGGVAAVAAAVMA